MNELDFKNCRYKNECRKYLIDKQCPGQNPNIDQNCLKLYKIAELQKAALLTEKQSEPIIIRVQKDSKDIESYDKLKDIENNIENFVNTGRNIFIYSSITGNGKTYWSLKLMQDYFETIWHKTSIRCRGLFINVPTFLIELKSNIEQKSEYISYIKANTLSADLIIWDDIATKGFTQYETEQLLSIINSRLNNRKSNIYTSNLAGDSLKQAMGDRLYSRVFTTSDVITFKDADKRGIFE